MIGRDAENPLVYFDPWRDRALGGDDSERRTNDAEVICVRDAAADIDPPASHVGDQLSDRWSCGGPIDADK